MMTGIDQLRDKLNLTRSGEWDIYCYVEGCYLMVVPYRLGLLGKCHQMIQKHRYYMDGIELLVRDYGPGFLARCISELTFPEGYSRGGISIA